MWLQRGGNDRGIPTGIAVDVEAGVISTDFQRVCDEDGKREDWGALSPPAVVSIWNFLRYFKASCKILFLFF